MISFYYQGCWLNDITCKDKNECIEEDSESENRRTGPNNMVVFYCCCEGNFCNRVFSYQPKPTTPSTSNLFLKLIVFLYHYCVKSCYFKGNGDHSEVQDKFCSNFKNMLIRSLRTENYQKNMGSPFI